MRSLMFSMQTSSTLTNSKKMQLTEFFFLQKQKQQIDGKTG